MNPTLKSYKKKDFYGKNGLGQHVATTMEIRTIEITPDNYRDVINRIKYRTPFFSSNSIPRAMNSVRKPSPIPGTSKAETKKEKKDIAPTIVKLEEQQQPEAAENRKEEEAEIVPGPERPAIPPKEDHPPIVTAPTTGMRTRFITNRRESFVKPLQSRPKKRRRSQVPQPSTSAPSQSDTKEEKVVSVALPVEPKKAAEDNKWRLFEELIHTSYVPTSAWSISSSSAITCSRAYCIRTIIKPAT